MKNTIIIAMAFYCLSAKAQKEPRNFVYLYNDSMVTARQVSLRADAFNGLQVYTGRQRYPAQQVQFFKNEYGFFANTRKLNFVRQDEFVERVTAGKINLYDRVAYDPYFIEDDSPIAVQNSSHISNRQTVFFNKGLGPLMRINYDNLKKELSDNPASMDLLAAYRKERTASVLWYTAAGASFIACAIFGFKATMKDTPAFDMSMPNYTPSYVLFGGTVAFSLIGLSKTFKSQRHFYEAVDGYNR